MVIVDDHLALLAVAGHRLDLGAPGPVATTAGFQFRLARAVADSGRSGSLSRELADPAAALRRVLAPPAHRLVVLDPRISMAAAVEVAGATASTSCSRSWPVPPCTTGPPFA